MTKQRETDESRPPLYNSEDYIAALKRFSKLTGLQMYLSNGGGYDVNNDKSEDKGGGGNKSAKSAKNDTSASSTASAATGLVLQNLQRESDLFLLQNQISFVKGCQEHVFVFPPLFVTQHIYRHSFFTTGPWAQYQKSAILPSFTIPKLSWTSD